MKLEPRFWTTAIGSFPHETEYAGLYERLATSLDIPIWPQLVRRTFYENMYVQYSAALPGVVVDEANEKITFDTTGDLTEALEAFYTPYLAEEVDAFGLTPQYAAGFFGMLEALQFNGNGEWVKGHVTGPISVGLTVTDQDLRASLYNEMLADVLVKNAAMNARWQVQQLRTVRPNAIIFVDEPYMASFGSAYISLDREQAIAMLDEVFAAIHQEGALAGTHCCANTDWSVLLATTVDILNLDAYGYMENLALYPEELRAFLDRGGVIAWGIAPTNEEIYEVTPETLAQKLRQGLDLIQEKAQARGVKISSSELATRSLITPACGLGPTTVEIAERALGVLVEMGEILQEEMEKTNL
jgi:methionine synthase II (cobalamin-independent)